MSEPLIQIAALMKRRLRGCYSWTRENFMPWLEWHAKRQHVIMIRNGGKVLGFILGRGITTPTDSRRRYACNDESDLVHVEYCVATRPGVMPELFKGLWARFPHATRVSFKRHKSGEKIKTYDVARIIQLAERMG